VTEDATSVSCCCSSSSSSRTAARNHLLHSYSWRISASKHWRRRLSPLTPRRRKYRIDYIVNDNSVYCVVWNRPDLPIFYTLLLSLLLFFFLSRVSMQCVIFFYQFRLPVCLSNAGSVKMDGYIVTLFDDLVVTSIDPR